MFRLALGIIFGLISLGTLLNSESFAESEWYPGINLEKGDYFKYDFCHIDYFECRSQELEFLIINETQNYWYIQTIVTDQKTKIDEVLRLSKNEMKFIGSGHTMRQLASVFNNSLVWLNNFSNQDTPKHLKLGEYWGQIGNIGGGVPFTTGGNEMILINSNSIEATVVNWPLSNKTSKIWIVKDYPFPIKAETFVHIGLLPIQYEFELIEHKKMLKK